MVHLDPDEKVIGHVATVWKDRPAVLTLTARRLLVSRSTRLPRRTDRTFVSVDWSEVARTSVATGASGRGRLIVETAGAADRPGQQVELPVDDPMRLQRAIDRQVAAHLGPSKDARAGGSAGPAPVHVHLTVHQPVVRAASPSVYVRCSYCRTVYPELDGKCPSCGAAF